MKCMLSLLLLLLLVRMIVGCSGDLCADALPVGEAAVDHGGGFGAPRRSEVVASADLAEPALQGQELLVDVDPSCFGLAHGLLRRTAQKSLGLGGELSVLRVAVGLHQFT